MTIDTIWRAVFPRPSFSFARFRRWFEVVAIDVRRISAPTATAQAKGIPTAVETRFAQNETFKLYLKFIFLIRLRTRASIITIGRKSIQAAGHAIANMGKPTSAIAEKGMANSIKAR